MATPPTPARGLGTGGISIGFAKLFFLFAGYAVSIYLTQLVSPATYGDYNVLSQFITVPNMVLIQSLLFAVSRPMSAELASRPLEEARPVYAGLRRRGFAMALGLALPKRACVYTWRIITAGFSVHAVVAVRGS